MPELVYITRCAEFSASHRMHNPQLSAEENELLFRNCNWPNGHGHNYLLEVTVCGEVDPRSGMVMNLKDLKAAIQTRILDKCDHRCLNLDVDFLADQVCSAENLCRAFWRELEEELQRLGTSARLYSIRIRETRDNCCTYFGPCAS
ncbi:MAG: 6-pyruvoyl tetrahydrobiopterin synthase [Planctomycetota bacterium]|nr:MAG: 6-pyruvoyl tetrahydrobiopterin synthase [Planctomycetota bacterium]